MIVKIPPLVDTCSLEKHFFKLKSVGADLLPCAALADNQRSIEFDKECMNAADAKQGWGSIWVEVRPKNDENRDPDDLFMIDVFIEAVTLEPESEESEEGQEA